MDHNFIKELNIPNYIDDRLVDDDLEYFIKCSNCKLEIAKWIDSNYEYFYLNNKEIFIKSSYAKLQDITLSCEELIIKSLLE